MRKLFSAVIAGLLTTGIYGDLVLLPESFYDNNAVRVNMDVRSSCNIVIGFEATNIKNSAPETVKAEISDKKKLTLYAIQEGCAEIILTGGRQKIVYGVSVVDIARRKLRRAFRLHLEKYPELEVSIKNNKILISGVFCLEESFKQHKEFMQKHKKMFEKLDMVIDDKTILRKTDIDCIRKNKKKEKNDRIFKKKN